ncbi:Cytochrome b-c1 complex subunit 8 [Rhynchospora pubera]|uniref:Cytochrome b-c1 complex subunit 8 n=1 Tax=Rhynchospora pubera TaxID=906938 RepID=A0AAV8BX57_9POAL|nr:Cytochrome b-c1 complex subunit 8 [Rhynchospora pubera]
MAVNGKQNLDSGSPAATNFGFPPNPSREPKARSNPSQKNVHQIDREREREREREMGKQPVRLKAVVYSLSPFQQKVMPGLWKDITTKIHHKVTENWLNATLLLTPIIGTYSYAQHYKEQEKLEHRY